MQIGTSLLEVARAMTAQFERYALATLVAERIGKLIEQYPDAIDGPACRALLADARDLAARNAYKPLPPPEPASQPTTRLANPIAPNLPGIPALPRTSGTTPNPPGRGGGRFGGGAGHGHGRR